MEEFMPILYPEYGFSSPHKQKRHNISKIAPDSGPLIGSCSVQKSFIGSGNGMDGNTLGSVNKKVSALSNNGLEGLANFDIGYGSGSPISAEKRRSSEKGGIESGIGNAATSKRGTNLHILDQLSESGFGMFKKSVPSPGKSGTVKSEDTDPDSKVLPQQPITSSPGSSLKIRSFTIQPDTKGTDSSKYKVAPVETLKQQSQDRAFCNSSQNAGKSIPSNIEKERVPVSKAYHDLERSSSRREDIQHRNIETAEKACQTCPEELSQSIGVQTNSLEQSIRSNTYNACSSSSFSPKVSDGPSVRINSHHSSGKKDGMSNRSWLMVDDIRLMTQPSTGSPPSRSPPTAGITKLDEQLKPSKRHIYKATGKEQLPESSGQPQAQDDAGTSFFSVKEQIQDVSNATAAMMEAVDRAEAKLKSAREKREGKGTVPMKKGKEANPTSRKEENREVRDGKRGDGKRVDSDTHVDTVGSDKEAVERASHELRERALKKAAERVAAEAQEKLRAASVRGAEDSEREHQKMHVQVEKQSRDTSTRQKNPSLNRAEGHCSEVHGGNQTGGNPISGTAQSEYEPSEVHETKSGKHRHLERAAKALEEKNERDMNAQHEQEERIRASEMLDGNIRQWAAGKEGNVRALLSTLHQILWAECGWQPVLLSDLCSGSDVKKAYRKATLCLHPDKVQQKGATLHQKYIAEKIFNLLKDAWKKFESTELF